MKEFKYYKQLIGAIILAGIMIMMALRISDIASGLDTYVTAFVPLIVGACIAFVLDILVVRYERWLWPKCDSGWKYKIRRPLSLLLSFVTDCVFYCSDGVTSIDSFYVDYCSCITAYGFPNMDATYYRNCNGVESNDYRCPKWRILLNILVNGGQKVAHIL